MDENNARAPSETEYKELIGILQAISIVAKRLADKLLEKK